MGKTFSTKEGKTYVGIKDRNHHLPSNNLRNTVLIFKIETLTLHRKYPQLISTRMKFEVAANNDFI